MMSPAFLYFLNVVMISRWVFAFWESPITKKRQIIMLVIQLLGISIFYPGWPLWILVLLLTSLSLLNYWMENNQYRKQKKLKPTLNRTRLIFLIVYILSGSIFFSRWAGLDFNPLLASFCSRLGSVTLLVEVFCSNTLPIEWTRLQLIVFGALLVTHEANLPIRLLLQSLKLAPSANDIADEKQSSTINEQEFNAGRVIGILERLLIYFFVLNAQYSAIGFILAAKSFTRFRDLEKRTFAEYVLVGTLLSAFLSVLGAGLVQILLSGLV